MSDLQLSIRRARAEDASAAIALVIDSIRIACAVDHQNDAPTLERWLANKTVSNFQRWLLDSANFIVVAERAAALRGVALLHESGEIRLCYVASDARREGVGRALLGALEAEASSRGVQRLHLMSTGNARTFYEQLGYALQGAPSVAFGILQQHPYAKQL